MTLAGAFTVTKAEEKVAGEGVEVASAVTGAANATNMQVRLMTEKRE